MLLLSLLSAFSLFSFLWIIHAPLLEGAIQAGATFTATRRGVPTRLLQMQSRFFQLLFGHRLAKMTARSWFLRWSFRRIRASRFRGRGGRSEFFEFRPFAVVAEVSFLLGRAILFVLAASRHLSGRRCVIGVRSLHLLSIEPR